MRTSRHCMVVSGTGELREQIWVQNYGGPAFADPVLGGGISLLALDVYPSLQWRLEWIQNLLRQNPFIPARPHQLPFASILPPNPICFHPSDVIVRWTIEFLLLCLIIAPDVSTPRERTLSRGHPTLLRLTCPPMILDWILGHKQLYSSSNQRAQKLDQSSWVDRDHPVKIDVKKQSSGNMDYDQEDSETRPFSSLYQTSSVRHHTSDSSEEVLLQDAYPSTFGTRDDEKSPMPPPPIPSHRLQLASHSTPGSTGHADQSSNPPPSETESRSPSRGSQISGKGGKGKRRVVAGADDDDDFEEGDDDGGGRRRRKFGKKTTMACHFCRKRKLKCDGKQPQCGTCWERHEVCTWDDAPRRRGPGKKTRGGSVQSAGESSFHLSSITSSEATSSPGASGRGPGPQTPTRRGREASTIPVPIPYPSAPPMVTSSSTSSGSSQRGQPSTSAAVSLPPLKDLGLPTITTSVGGRQQYAYGPRPGEGDHRWLTGFEIESAASTISRQTLSRETPSLRGRPPGGRIPTQSRGHARSSVTVIDPRIRPQEEEDSEEDTEEGSESDTEQGDRVGR